MSILPKFLNKVAFPTNRQVPLAPAPAGAPPAFVMGGADDNVVDVAAVNELARYFGVPPVVVPSLAHDCMLDTRWEAAAGELRRWLDGLTASAGR